MMQNDVIMLQNYIVQLCIALETIPNIEQIWNDPFLFIIANTQTWSWFKEIKNDDSIYDIKDI